MRLMARHRINVRYKKTKDIFVDVQLYPSNGFFRPPIVLLRKFIIFRNKKNKLIVIFICSKWFYFSRGIKDVTILVGTNDLKSGGVRYTPEKFIMHEKYNRPPLANDVGLIRVKSIELNENVQPIKYTSNFVEGGLDLQTTGWGRLTVSIIFNSFILKVTIFF